MAKTKKQPSKKKRQVLVIHGPNLNMLGKREPDIYGDITLDQVNSDLKEHGKHFDLEIETFQSNHEGAIVEKIQQSMEGVDGLIINPGAYTHTSIAIRDALAMLSIPIIEVHLSNIYTREEFRRKSMISDVVTGQISGFGSIGYMMAVEGMILLLYAMSEDE